MKYNTKRKQLILPEFGRNVQQMVDHCVSLEDRSERNRCARRIVSVMRNLFSEQFNGPDAEREIWDHINIMSDFKLDVDFPYDVITREKLNPAPSPVPYTQSNLVLRQYGKIVELMANRVAGMEEGPEREKLVKMLANHMKLEMSVSNPDAAEDAKIFHDMSVLTRGAITLDPATTRLHDYATPQPAPTTTKKKKKK